MIKLELPKLDILKPNDIYSIDSPNGRVYVTPKGKLPSVTTVLGNSSDNTWLDEWKERIGEEKANKISKDASNVGTELHFLLEHYIKESYTKEDFAYELKHKSTKAQLFFRQLWPMLERYVDKYIALEVPMYSIELGIAGRSDLIAQLKCGTYAVVDYKSNNKIDRKKTDDSVEDYKIQIAAYSVMYKETYGYDIPKGLILMTNGILNQRWEFETEEYIDKLKDRIRTYHEKQSSKLTSVY